ncbi:MAG: undecaprenyl-diphosphate phosphatase [bacterium]
MNWLEGVVLGLVQGVTEILPVSSDGHLAVLLQIWQIPEVVRVNLTAVLHLGTAMAILFFLIGRVKAIIFGFFKSDPKQRHENRRLVMLIAVASVPAVLAGLVLEKLVERAFVVNSVIAFFFIVNGAIVFLTRYARHRHRQVDVKTAFLIGLVQATAILPAISRSGTTISLALFLGLSSAQAFEFSFLLALPITFGAAFFELLKVDFSVLTPAPVILGIIVSFGVGFLMINLLRRAVLSRGFSWFGVYCWVAGLAVLLLLR